MTEREYRNKLKDKLIEYRNELNLGNAVTFGVEIEYENVMFDLVSYFLDYEQNYDTSFIGWTNHIEVDISEFNKDELMNGEIVSPILTDNIETWKNLKIILDMLKRNDAVITDRCGGHVNIGTQILNYNTNYFRNLFLLWLLYEKEIYNFSSGEYSSVRKRDNNLLKRIALTLNSKIDEILENENDLFTYLKKVLVVSDSYDITFKSVKGPAIFNDNRIEIRIPNGTLNEEILQNNINFFTKFLLVCRNELDIEKIIWKISRNDHSPVELANLVFKEQLDKDNFLIQTLKTNKIYQKTLPKHIIY